MHPGRIAELLDPFLGPANDQPLTANDLEDISTYIDILLRWNARINLTAIRTEEEIVTRHFGESLFAAQHLFPNARLGTAALGPPAGVRPAAGDPSVEERDSIQRRRAALPRQAEWKSGASAPRKGPGEESGASAPDRPRLADVGSGAGFPGLPIKLWAPQISLTMIESNHKKATFLREITRALTLTDVNIQTARAETLLNTSLDTVTLRAVERFEAILPIAAGLVAPGGRLALLIGDAQLNQARAILPELTWPEPVHIPGSRSRLLALARK